MSSNRALTQGHADRIWGETPPAATAASESAFDTVSTSFSSYSTSSWEVTQLLPLGTDGSMSSSGESDSFNQTSSLSGDSPFTALATMASAVYTNGTKAVGTAASSAGLVINLVWDASVASAPSGFKTAIQAAASMIQQYVVTPITVNIAVGWGEIGGFSGSSPYTVPANSALGMTLGDVAQSYSTVKQELASNATSTDDASVLAALPSTSPFGSAQFDIAGAQAKAFGVTPAASTQIDGAIGFATNWPSTYYVAAALHEITHAMGRNSGWGGTNYDTTLLDLTRFSAPGVFATDGSLAQSTALQYFSLDGGKTVLAYYDNTSDYGDFAATSQTVNDPNNAYLSSNSNAMTALDIRTLDVMGFNLVGSTPAPPPSNPDLVVSSLSTPTNTLSQGDSLSYSFTVSDTGTGPAGASTASVYLDGQLIANTSVAALAAGASLDFSNSLSTAGLALGQHSLTVTADTGGVISETFEYNNSTTLTFTVLAKSSPDLTISSLTSSTASVVQGSNFSYAYTVNDIGTAASSANTLGIAIDGQAVSTAQIAALLAGGSSSATGSISTVGLAIGSHVLTLSADSTGLIAESNETNNSISLSFNVTGPNTPDLTITSALSGSGSVTQGGSLAYSYAIKDSGTASAGSSVTNVLLDGRLIATNSTTSLAAGSSTIMNGSLNTVGLTAGQHVLSFVADATNLVKESDETNNSSSLSFTVNTPSTKSDLQIAGLAAVSNSTLIQGDYLVFSYGLKNTGGDTAGSSKAAYQIDSMPTASNYYGYNSFGSVYANASGGSVIDYINTSKLSVGSHTLYVMADAGNTVSESNETNNVSSFTFNVVGRPDYSISALSMPTTVQAGGKFTLNYTVTNSGASQPWLSSYASIYFDGYSNSLSYDIIKGLAPNSSQNFSDTFSVGANVAKGVHTVTITADATNYVNESNELNNTKTFSFRVV